MNETQDTVVSSERLSAIALTEVFLYVSCGWPSCPMK